MTIDFFPTPPGLADAALKHEFYFDPADLLTVLDPGCGTGVWGQAVRRMNCLADITGIDVRAIPKPDGYDRFIRANYLDHASTDGLPYKLIVGNPPFSQAEEFIRHAWSLASWNNGWIVFLLRLSMLGSQRRGKGLWRDLPPSHVAVLSRRPSFSGDNRQDNSEYAIFYWQKLMLSRKVTGKPTLSWLDWKE